MEESRKVIDEIVSEMGYQLKREQRIVISSFFEGRDVLYSSAAHWIWKLKSLCYFALPRILDKIRRDTRPSIVIVVTPLTALMKDQVISWPHQQQNIKLESLVAIFTWRAPPTSPAQAI